MKKIASAILAGSLMLLGNTALAADKNCDRACLKEMAQKTLVSMTKHSREGLPLGRWYSFTENGAPAAPEMTSLWRSVTRFTEPGAGQYAIDPKTGQVFVVAEVFEGEMPSIVFFRLKVEDRLITELEMYISRAKGESGLKFAPEELSSLPPAWLEPVPVGQKANREELTKWANSVFDRSFGTPPESKTCELVEMGGRVVEDPDALKTLMPGDDLATDRPLKHGVSVPCTFDKRPEAKNARILVDEETGIVVSFGVVPGIVYPSFIEKGSESTFVPTEIKDGFENLPAEMRDPNKAGSTSFVPVLKQMESTMAVAEMTRFYDGKVQGVQRYMNMQPIGGNSPWSK
ncbi:hypothetical protein [Oceanobacter mangrovi]|uniref:hypothetical protein n=1 Tax=Oceanobacter mangrovi TaxID=2862510 RepID=UPI001C8DB7A6|nr:hypothetical protein [Oceanobacter mangrovi]